jgi:type III secretory pathway component EscU
MCIKIRQLVIFRIFIHLFQVAHINNYIFSVRQLFNLIKHILHLVMHRLILWIQHSHVKITNLRIFKKLLIYRCSVVERLVRITL